MTPEKIVTQIINDVKKFGDEAIFTYSLKFDDCQPAKLKTTNQEIKNAYKSIAPESLTALIDAKKNIEKFNKNILSAKEPAVQIQKGVYCWREFRPIENVGLYIPGGNANYASTVLMLGVPARLAGCGRIIICSPPPISAITLVAADLAGIKEIYKVGGAQAIAAMAYGTGTIAKMDKIFGPGNKFVTAAKMAVSQDVAIDMPAGPSEIAILADGSANPDLIKADLASQLEHGPDSEAILVTTSKKLAARIKIGKIIKVESLAAAIVQINKIAPEHLEIMAKKPGEILKKINNAGSVFIGNYSPVPAGDYMTGPNHTLPTSGWARSVSALSIEDFGKMMEVQKLTKNGLRQISKNIVALAKAEGLPEHAESIKIRFYD